MEKPYFFIPSMRRGAVGWLFMLCLLFCSFSAFAQVPKPTDFSVASLTQISTIVTWECSPSQNHPAGAVLHFDYVVSTNALSASMTTPEFNALTETTEGVVALGKKIEMTSHQLYIDGLSSGTTYYMLIRQNADDIYELPSDWVSFSFTTLCDAVDLPVDLLDFNESTIPPCWVLAGERLPYLQTYTKYGDFGNSLKFESTAEDYSMLFSPVLAGGSGSSEIKFKIYTGASKHQRFSVGVADASDIMSYIPLLQDSIALGQWHDVSVIDRENSFSDNYVWVIFAEAGFPSVFFVDNVTIQERPACVPPKGLTVTNVTATTATFSWTPQDWETAWNLELTSGSLTEPIVVPVTANPFTYENLNEGTIYSARIQADCGSANGTSEWSLPVSFTTPLVPQAVPFTCDFETPSPWAFLNGDATNAWTIGSAVSNGGEKALYISKDAGSTNTYNNSLEAKVWALKLLQISEEADYMVKFNWHAEGDDYNDYLLALVIPADVQLEAGSSNGLNFDYTMTTAPEGWTVLGGKLNKSSEWKTAMEEAHLMPGEYYLAFYWTNNAYGGNDPSAAIDNVSVSKILCPTPQLPTLGVVNEDGATLVMPDEGTYNVKVFDAETANPEQGTAAFTQNNITDLECLITGLEARTTYYAYLQAVCDAGGSEWVGPVLFTTICDVITDFPFVEDFNDLTAGIPDCWDNTEGTTITESHRWTYFTPSYDGAGLRFNSYFNGGGNTNFLKTPKIRLNENSQLTFMCKKPASAGRMSVYISVDGAPYTNDTLLTNIVAEDWQEFLVNLSEYTGHDVILVFAAISNGAFDPNAFMYLDDVEIGPLPSCPRPLSFVIKDVKSAQATVEVKDTDHDQMVDVEYGPVGFVLGEGTQVQIPEGDSVITITGLDPQTSYDVYVRNHCAENDMSQWMPKLSFTTSCAAFVVDAANPFIEDFESYDSEDVGKELGGCWQQLSVEKSWNLSAGGYGVYPRGSYAASLSFSADAWVYRRVYLAPGNYQISCYAMQDQPSGFTLSLSYGESIDDMNEFYSQEIGNGEYQQVRSEFTVTREGDYLIGLHGQSISRPNIMLVDDFKLSLVNCLTPSQPAVSAISDDAAKVSWRATEAATYNLKLFTAVPADVETETPVYSKTDIVPVDGQAYDSITGLSPKTTYYVYVQSVCGEESRSEWTNPVSFTTECSAVALSKETPYVEGFEDADLMDCWTITVFEEGDANTTTSVKHSGTTSYYAYKASATSPKFSFEEGTNFSNYMLSGFAYTSAENQTVIVNVRKDSETAQSTVEIEFSAINEWQEFTINLSPLAAVGEDLNNYKYIEFNFTGEEPIYMDDLRLEIIPTCPKPSVITFSGITEGSANMDWNVNGAETQWHILVKEVGAEGTVIDEITSQKPYSITGLQSNTLYEVLLSAICAEDEESSQISTNFRTGCSVFTLPFSENFNSLTEGIPSCWDNSEGTTTTDAYKWNYYSSGKEGACLRFDSYKNENGNTNILRTPVFDLEGDVRLSFAYKNPIGTYDTGAEFHVVLCNEDGTVLDTVARNLQSPAWQDTTLNLSTYAGQNAFVKFVGICHSHMESVFGSEIHYGSYLDLDNILMEIIPTCEKPQEVTVSSLATEATIEVTDNSHTAWEYVCGISGFDADAATPVEMASNTATITGLSASTNYELYVRAVCSEDDKSEWLGPISFSTKTLPVSLPYTCGFEDTEAWILLNGTATNTWAIGAATNNGGSQALYISNDGGENNTYAFDATSRVWAIKNFEIEEENMYYIGFDWKAQGEETADYLTAFIVPASFEIVENSDNGVSFSSYLTNIPEGWISLSGTNRLNLSGEWQRCEIEQQLAPGIYQLAFFWRNDQSNGELPPAAIDNVSISKLACPSPALPTFGNITETQAVLTFAEEGAYNVKVFDTKQTDVSTAEAVFSQMNVAGTNCTVTGLMAGHTYYAYIQAICDEGVISKWTEAEFFTACSTESLPFVENFDNIDDFSPCWTNAHTAGSNVDVWSVSTSNAYSGKAAYMNYQYEGNKVVLATPGFNVEAGKEYRVSYYMYHHTNSYYHDSLNVYCSATALPDEVSTLLGTAYAYVGSNVPELGTDAGHYKHEYRWTQIQDDVIYIAFEMVWDDGLAVSIDEIVVEEVPSCETPVAVTVNNVFADAVDILITDPLGSAWEAVVGPKGFSPEEDGLTITQLPNLSGRVPGTFESEVEMELYVRSDCGADDGKSRWYGPVVFKYIDWTVIADEDIAVAPVGDYPWEITTEAGISKVHSTNVGVDNSTSDLTASFTLEEGERATLSFDYYVSSEASNSYMMDYLMIFVDPQEGFSDSNYDLSFGKKGGDPAESGTHTIAFEESGTHTVIWRYYKNYSGAAGEDMAKVWNITLDKTNFYEPEDLKVSNIIENNATLTWTPSIGANKHQVRLVRVGGDTVYFDNLTDATVQLTPLQPGTEYKVDVRSIRGTQIGDTTIWSEAQTFRTIMVPLTVADLPYLQDWEDATENANWELLNAATANKWIISDKDENAVAENVGSALYVSNNDSANQYSISVRTNIYAYRSFNLEAGAYSLGFDWKATGELHDYLRVFLVPTETALQAGTYNGTSTSLPEGWIALTGCLYGVAEWQTLQESVMVEEAGYYNLVFLWTNDGFGGLQTPAAIDNVTLDQISCSPVSNMRIVDRGADFIEVAWDSPFSDAFQAVYVPEGTDIGTIDVSTLQTLTEDRVRFDNLTENSLYDIYVRSVCDDTYSDWTSLKSVMAFAEFAYVPYRCDFETAEANAWTLINGTQTNQWHVGTAINNGGEKALYISKDNGLTHEYNQNSASSVYAARKFRLTEAGLYTISYSWICNGEGTWDYLRVFLAPADAELLPGEMPSVTSWITLGSANNSGVTSWRIFSKEMELQSGDYQLVFYWKNDGNSGDNPPAAIDNVSFVNMTCTYPKEISADGITDNSARLFWKGEAASYEVKVDESDAVVAMQEPFFSAAPSDTTITLSGLNPQTRYYVAVRSVCAEGDESIWVTYSFETLCTPFELPYSETFDADPFEGCWEKFGGTFEETVTTESLSAYSTWSFSSTPYGNMDEHMRLEIAGTSCSNWLISPSIKINDVTNQSLCFDMSLNPYSSYTTFEPGKQQDDKFIVAISTDNGRTWNRSNARIWDNAGSDYVFDNIAPQGEPVIMNLADYAESGDTIRIAFYGESTVTGGDNYLRIDNMAINMIETVELSDSICARTSYTDNGFNIPAEELTPGLHHQFTRFEMAVTEGVNDKLYELDLYVFPDATIEVYDTVCAGTPYTKYGFNLEEPTTRTYYSQGGLFTVNGCDSMVTLHLFVPETQFTASAIICEGESYAFGTQTLTESGSYTETFAGTYCDSTVTLTLTVLPANTEESVTLCHGDSILFDNVWRKTSGDYTATFRNILDCDSTVTLHLTVRDEIRYAYTGVLCSGGTYSDDNFSNLREADEYTKVLESVDGCDSTIVLTLIEKAITPTTFNEEICEGEVYTFGDVDYNMTGDYPHTFESVDGCDSVVTLRLTVLPVSESDLTLEITTDQLPYEIKHNGEVVYVVEEGTEPGTTWPEIVIENGAVNGCDSIIHLTLTVKLSDALSLTGYDELQMWPNPIERGGKVRIAAEFSASDRNSLKVEVFNSIGQCVATHHPKGDNIYVDDFHVSGMYLVKVTTGTGKLYVGHVLVK